MDQLISMAVEAEQSGLFQTLWVGDSILAKRRPESVVVLAAIASRTRRVRLGVGCMASFPIRNPLLLATQWATLDMVAGPDSSSWPPAWEVEEAEGLGDGARCLRNTPGPTGASDGGGYRGATHAVDAGAGYLPG